MKTLITVFAFLLFAFPVLAHTPSEFLKRGFDLASDRAARRADEEVLGVKPVYRVRQDSLWQLIGESGGVREQWEFVGVVVPADTCIRRLSTRRRTVLETWEDMPGVK